MKHIQKPRVAVLILGYNHRDFIIDTLRSVQAQTYTNYHVIYIDNASTDDSVSLVRHTFPDVEAIKHPTNIGYAGGYNQTLTRVFTQEYDAAVLLNPDTVSDTHWLSELVASAYADKTIGFAQPKIYLWEKGATNSFNTAGNEINFLGFGYCGQYKHEDDPLLTQDTEITYASGASLLIKKEAYEMTSGFDDDFFAYLEDQDLGWRGKLLGYTSVLSARSLLWHKYDFQKKHLNNFKFFLLERNRFTFILKNFEIKTLLLILPACIIMETGVLLDSIMKGYFKAKLRGYFETAHNLRKTLHKRSLIQKTRVRTDKELFHFLNPEILFEEVDSPLLRGANIFLRCYYHIVKHLI
jgi:hypothetical protein